MQFSPISIKTSSMQSCGAHYFGSKIFNHLLSFIKELSNNVKSFKIALKTFLMTDSFHSVDEFLRDF
jgi:hypothetical protein